MSFVGDPVSFAKAVSVWHQCNLGKEDCSFRILWWDGKETKCYKTTAYAGTSYTLITFSSLDFSGSYCYDAAIADHIPPVDAWCLQAWNRM